MKLFLLFLVMFSLSISAETLPKFIFGIVPQQSATNLLVAWAPLLKQLEMDCSCKIEFASSPSISEFEASFKKGRFDLLYLNPLHFLEAQKIGYTALVRENERKLKGIIIVKKESKFQDIKDLKNAKIAFPGPTAFAASVLTQNIFEKMHIPYKKIYVKTHDSVYKNILMGLTDAGGGINRTFEALSEEDRSKLRILFTTSEVTPHPIAVKKTMNPEIRKKLLRSLLQLNESASGREILKNLEFKSLVEARDSDWDDVKTIIKTKKISHEKN